MIGLIVRGEWVHHADTFAPENRTRLVRWRGAGVVARDASALCKLRAKKIFESHFESRRN
ncbi:hypothetical protein [Paraburkholderia sp. SIMBA_030]|uniref:hypothetical protein n=1 Tax=Paraburkholderia sp. SIMBA_030 TaxID=3085773 RepID=UPI00397ADCB2